MLESELGKNGVPGTHGTPPARIWTRMMTNQDWWRYVEPQGSPPEFSGVRPLGPTFRYAEEFKKLD